MICYCKPIVSKLAIVSEKTIVGVFGQMCLKGYSFFVFDVFDAGFRVFIELKRFTYCRASVVCTDAKKTLEPICANLKRHEQTKRFLDKLLNMISFHVIYVV